MYAELASRHPDTGGEYAFLSRGLGRGVAFVFAWSRMTVIQTGAIAAVAFVFGDYASEILRLGREELGDLCRRSAVVALTALNVAGTLRIEDPAEGDGGRCCSPGLRGFIAVAGFLAGAPAQAGASGAGGGALRPRDDLRAAHLRRLERGRVPRRRGARRRAAT